MKNNKLLSNVVYFNEQPEPEFQLGYNRLLFFVRYSISHQIVLGTENTSEDPNILLNIRHT